MSPQFHSTAAVAQTLTGIDANVYYYSYSTLAQTLAGAFGFLAAVVLYRLQALNLQLENLATRLIGDVATFRIEPFRTLYAYHRWHLFVEHVKKDQDSGNRNPVFKDLNFLDIGAMEHANQQILSIRLWFLISMAGTVVGITLGLIALFAMAVFQSMALLVTLLVIGILCLASYVRLLVIVLQ